jgi:threonine/homoserine/homoserine lactone efflux protein
MGNDHLYLAMFAGFVCGLVVSIPVGPVNLSVINQALRRGFLQAFLVGLGAAAAETIYASVCMAGHSEFLNRPYIRDVMRVAALVVIGAVGVRALLIKAETFEARSAERADRMDQRWHHPRSFLLGFVMTIFNLLLVVLWATISTVLFAHEWVTESLSSRSSCAMGVFLGCALWFFLLALFVSRAHRRVKPQTMMRLMRASGVAMLIFGALLGYKLFRG